MTSGRTACELAVLAAVCVLTIFFFPAMQGPYSTVHGPVSVMQAARSAARLRLAIVQAGLKSCRNCLLSPLAVLLWMGFVAAEFLSTHLTACDSVLRC